MSPLSFQTSPEAIAVPEHGAATRQVELRILPGEYWWGGIVRHGDRMPFSAETAIREKLFDNLDGNQGCPLLLSSKGRFIWSEEPFSFEFKDGCLTVDTACGVVAVEEGHRHLRGAYHAASTRFFPASGRLAPDLAFLAPQYNGWIDMHRHPTQERVYNYAQAILDAGMPPGVLMIDNYWFKHNGLWHWDRDAFPDAKKMVADLHDLGFLVVLWVGPWVSGDTRLFRALKDKGYLLKCQDGQPAIQGWWDGYSAVLDLSNPDAFAWLQSELDHLVDDYGIDGFKFDGGDPFRYLTTDKPFTARTPVGHCEDFARVGLRYPIAEYRACWKLGGQHLLQRVRDKGHKWGVGGLADTIPTALAQGLVGYAYNCPDMVGGGEETEIGTIDQELFIRWAQAATFFPIVQYSLLPMRVLDAEHLAMCMDIVKLRMRLGPEILRLARHAAATGEPIMRHMAYVFPDDSMETVLDQYMLGDTYLVAPVLTKGSVSRTVRFPTGVWKGDDGSIVQGPCTATIDTPLWRLPWYELTDLDVHRR